MGINLYDINVFIVSLDNGTHKKTALDIVCSNSTTVSQNNLVPEIQSQKAQIKILLDI